jgi:hypothetical protein
MQEQRPKINVEELVLMFCYQPYQPQDKMPGFKIGELEEQLALGKNIVMDGDRIVVFIGSFIRHGIYRRRLIDGKRSCL